jgi:hypothetical protein
MMRSDWENTATLLEQLQLLELSSKEKRWYRADMARQVKRKISKNIKAQSGKKGRFDKRQRKRTLRGKMLSGFARNRNYWTRHKADSVTIGYKGAVGRVARMHQEGARTEIKARPMSSQRLEDMKRLSATAEQARALIRLGYTMPGRNKKRGRKKRVSQKWIKDNLSQHAAMLQITYLRNVRRKTAKYAELPARPFFPNDEEWVTKMAVAELRKLIRRIR